MMDDDDDDDDEGVPIYMTRADACKVADFLDAYGDEDDREIAANMRFQANAKAS